MSSATDARGKRIVLPRPPERIVSLVPSQTELLASLRLDDRVVGVTRFCVRPEHWREEKQIVGGTKSLRIDRIEKLQPDLILANLEENTREDVLRLEEIAPVFVTDVGNLDEAIAMIRAVARLTDCTADGGELCQAVTRAFDGLDSFEPLRTAYLIWRGPYMTVGRDTFIHDVMSQGGFENAFGRMNRYPTIDEATLIDADLDVLLLPDEPFPFSPKHMADFDEMLPGTSIHLVDGQLFSWYGSRLLHTPDYLRRLRSEMAGKA